MIMMMTMVMVMMAEMRVDLFILFNDQHYSASSGLRTQLILLPSH